MSCEQQKLRLKIPTARSKLQASFPQDPRGDIKIIVGKKSFKLQKAFLRLQSSYFQRKLSPSISTLSIQQHFDVQLFYLQGQQSHFQNVLKCFYGITIQIKRSQVLEYYPIIKYLQIECLLNFLKEDMVKNISCYDLFLLMRLAHEQSQQDIFQACLNQLQKQNFQQLNYSRFELLKSSQQLFKLIIKTHNRFKNDGKKGLSYGEVDQLIKEFCEEKNYSENQYHEMKFELIDKTALTSLEYKEIFLDQVKNVKKSFIGSSSFIKNQSGNYLANTQGGLTSLVKPNNLTQSMISPNSQKNNIVPNQLTLQMQNTFEKKLNQQLTEQNQILKKQLQNLKQISDENHKNNQQLKKILTGLQQLVKQKEQQDRKQKQLMIKMEKTILILKSHLDQKGQMIKKLEEKVTKLEKSTTRNYLADSDEDQEEEYTIQSQIVPAHLIGRMLPGQIISNNKEDDQQDKFKKKLQVNQSIMKQQQQMPEQEQLDDDDLEEMYMPRLAFVEEPLGTPKKYLPALADLITEQGWSKKRLTPIFRRSSQYPPLGKPSDIRGRNQLLILIKTQYGQFIGGYITVQLPKNLIGEYIEDRGAFLFSLSKKQKFPIQKSQVSEAIFLSDTYLVSFGNDLSIALDCIKDRSECSWPSSYHSSSQSSKSSWLIGGNAPFYIKQIEVYEVEEGEMEMVL